MTAGAVVVRKKAFSVLEYLALDGPFQYPRWVSSPRSAAVMTMARASGNASAHGGEALAFSGDVEDLARRAEKLFNMSRDSSRETDQPRMVKGEWPRVVLGDFDPGY